MSFAEELATWPAGRVHDLLARATPAGVEAAIGREERSPADFAALLSPQAAPRLETMAQESARLTRWHFGRTISLYAPIYLSNVCGTDCTYCGYAVRSGNTERRVTLQPPQIRAECQALAKQGFQNVLLLTGDAPHAVPVDYIAQGLAIAREYFPSVGVEVYALDQEDYARLCALGLEGVTLYMETYDRDTYRKVHLKGRKMDFDYRLGAIEHAGLAGARRIAIGVLLGLSDWRVDAFWLGLHAKYLQRTCWQSALSISFPRLRHVPTRFTIPHLVTDREMVQLMLAMRLLLPEAGFSISTRETPEFRDRLIPLGTTSMSAGSSTRPGGYSTYGEETLEQFEIEDRRSPREVIDAIRTAGYDPVIKDFDRAFDAVEH